MHIPLSSLPAFGNSQGILFMGEITKQFSGVIIPHLGTNRHPKNTRFSTFPSLLLAATVSTSSRSEVTLKMEVHKSLLGACGCDYHISASAAVPAVRTASRYILFPSKTDTSPAAVTSSDVDFDLVNKAHG
jgi:hypothetical protein